MLTLVSYPGLYGVADNNPFGLKVFAFLRLSGLAFRQEHVFDASAAPHGQLPCIDDNGTIIGDSGVIIEHLIATRGLRIDDGLTGAQRSLALCLQRTLDDLYWCMSYSRWKDDRFWPLFRDEILRTQPTLTQADLDAARAYNFERYRYQGIGRYAPDEAYRRGLADLGALADLIEPEGFLFGAAPGSIDASIYGFVANILYYPIDTPLRQFLLAQPQMVRHCDAIHAMVMAPDDQAKPG